MRGYLICRKCGAKQGQNTYDCDIPVICKECEKKMDYGISGFRAIGIATRKIEVDGGSSFRLTSRKFYRISYYQTTTMNDISLIFTVFCLKETRHFGLHII